MTLEARHAILDALLASLDEEHATAILDHRKTKKCPLTPFAAKLLAKEFAKCPDPNAAAEEMIIRGWTGFKADWMRDRSRFKPPAGKRMNAVEANFSLRTMDHEPTGQRRDYVDVERVRDDQPGLPSPAIDAGQAFGRTERPRHH
jgi:hypothetical protein